MQLVVAQPIHSVPSEVQEHLAQIGLSHCYIVSANLSIFLDREFLVEYILAPQASFVAVSLSTVEISAAITPQRKLCLRLNKQAYERLGLVGKRSPQTRGIL